MTNLFSQSSWKVAFRETALTVWLFYQAATAQSIFNIFVISWTDEGRTCHAPLDHFDFGPFGYRSFFAPPDPFQPRFLHSSFRGVARLQDLPLDLYHKGISLPTPEGALEDRTPSLRQTCRILAYRHLPFAHLSSDSLLRRLSDLDANFS